jgi:hypothetical protein
MPICRIHNGKYSYILVVDGKTIPFQYATNADYFQAHYEKLGYQVIRSGNGTSNVIETSPEQP